MNALHVYDHPSPLSLVYMSLVWLITGSSSPLGRALAEEVLAGGDQLVATARNLPELAGLVERYGERVRTVALDVTDERAASDAVETAVGAFGRLDVLVNNAGPDDVGSIADANLAGYFGVINLTKAVIPLMSEQRAGRIIQLSTSGEERGALDGAHSSAGSWGIAGFSEALARRVAPLGIKVTIVAPSGFERAFDGAELSNRAKATVIIHIASLDELPLRLRLAFSSHET
jgi:NAD(P)-dependent dehydrogenase (short-subunit alcohol dehydrogenase family)